MDEDDDDDLQLLQLQLLLLSKGVADAGNVAGYCGPGDGCSPEMTMSIAVQHVILS